MLALALAAVVMLASPAGPGAAEPHLAATRDGGFVMSWLEPAADKTHALKFASAPTASARAAQAFRGAS